MPGQLLSGPLQLFENTTALAQLPATGNTSNATIAASGSMLVELPEEVGTMRGVLVLFFAALVCLLWCSPLVQYTRFRKDVDVELLRKARTLRWPRVHIFAVCISACILESLQIAAYSWRHQPLRSGIHEFYGVFAVDRHDFHVMFWGVCIVVWLGAVSLWAVVTWRRADAQTICVIIEGFETFSIVIQSTAIRMINGCAFKDELDSGMDWKVDASATPNCASASYAGHLAAAWLCIIVYWVIVTELRARFHQRQSEFMIDFRFVIAQSQIKFLMALASQSPAHVLIPAFFLLNALLNTINFALAPFNIHQVNIARTITLSCSQVVIITSAMWFYFELADSIVIFGTIFCVGIVLSLGFCWHRRQIGSDDLQIEREMKEFIKLQAGTRDLLAAAVDGKLSSLVIDPGYHAVRAVCALIFDFKPAKRAFVVISARESEQIAGAVTSLTIHGDRTRGIRLDDATATILFGSIQHSNTTALTTLSLADHGFSLRAVQQLSSALRDNSNLPLQTLDLRLNDIDARGLAELTEFVRCNSTLRNLRLAGNRIVQIIDSEDLGNGYVDDGCFSFTAFKEFVVSLQTTGVTCLDLGDNSLSMYAGIAWQASLENSWPSLQSVNLEWNQLGCVGAESLAAVLSQTPQLRDINLRGNRIDNVGIAALGGSLGALSKLRTLQLEANNIGPQGITVLAAGLMQCTKLETLNLRRNDIQPKGLKALAECLASCTMSSLQTVNLAANALCGIDDLGSRYGVHGHSFVQQRVYDVSGIVALAGYLRQEGCTCQCLDLSHNHIGQKPTPSTGDAASPESTTTTDWSTGGSLSAATLESVHAKLCPDEGGGSSAAAVLAPAIAANTSLTFLFLQYNQLQPSCIASLQPALASSATLSVDLRGAPGDGALSSFANQPGPSDPDHVYGSRSSDATASPRPQIASSTNPDHQTLPADAFGHRDAWSTKAELQQELEMAGRRRQPVRAGRRLLQEQGECLPAREGP